MRDFLYLYVVVASIVALILITYSGITPTIGESAAAERATDPTVASSSSPFKDESEASKNLVNEPKHLPALSEGTASSPATKIITQPEIDSHVPAQDSAMETQNEQQTTGASTKAVSTAAIDILSEAPKTSQVEIQAETELDTEQGKPELQLHEKTSVLKQKTKVEEEEERRRHLMEITVPWTNVTTVGFWSRGFWAGFRNQMMSFSSFVMWCGIYNYSQILYPTIKHRDQYGTNRYIGFEELFDVEHWNSYYPTLPRMVHCNETIFPEYNCTKNKWINPPYHFVNATRPYAIAKQQHLFSQYKRYSQGTMLKFVEPVFPNPMDLAMIRGALRPHPDVQAIIDSALMKMNQGDNGSVKTGEGDSTYNSVSYMTLHARVEADMQLHPVCKDKKVLNLTDIIQMMYNVFPTPPVKVVFIPINRQFMEKEGYVNEKEPNATNWMAVHNLKELNRIAERGLWNGTVKVFEFGANALKGTKFENRSSVTGSLINFFIGLHGKIFIGSEVSSYALDLLSNRFYRNYTENYKYLPQGLVHWTPPGTVRPDGFKC